MTGLALFGGVGAGLVVFLAIFWAIVATRALEGAWRTTLFVAPCLAAPEAPARFETDAV